MIRTVSRRRRRSLIRCETCGGDAFVVGYDDLAVQYECAGTPQHAWSEERNPRCTRCAEPMVRHLPVTTQADREALVCPDVLTDHTFSLN
jgi:hypothetical protein